MTPDQDGTVAHVIEGAEVQTMQRIKVALRQRGGEVILAEGHETLNMTALKDSEGTAVDLERARGM